MVVVKPWNKYCCHLTVFTEVVNGIQAKAKPGCWDKTQTYENPLISCNDAITDQN